MNTYGCIFLPKTCPTSQFYPASVACCGVPQMLLLYGTACCYLNDLMISFVFSTQSPPPRIAVRSGHQAPQAHPGARKRIAFSGRVKQNKLPRFDEDEYEGRVYSYLVLMCQHRQFNTITRYFKISLFITFST